MTEADLQALVEAECTRLGLLWHHCKDSRHCDGPRGLPDLVIAGPWGILLRELKSADGTTSAEQDAWAWMLTRPYSMTLQGSGACTAPLWSVWRPADWESGKISRELAVLR